MALSLTPNGSLEMGVLGSVSLAGAEISAFDPGSDRFFVTTPDSGLIVVDASDPTAPVVLTTVDFTAPPFNFGNGVNSVAVGKGIVAVAVEAPNKTDPGMVFLLDTQGGLIKAIQVGSLPDMLTFTPNGKKILVANEAEPSTLDDLGVGEDQVDPAGSVSIIDLSAGAANATVRTAGFTAFDGQEQALRDEGVRIFQGNSVSQDVEPEYIAVAPDGRTAMVTLQEANAVAILDLRTGTFKDIVPLGLKSFEQLLTDFSDKPGLAYAPVTGLPVQGMYMPDAIASYRAADGGTYYVIANEGDDRDDFIVGGEKARLGTLDLDDATFPNEAALKASAALGRLNTPNPAQVGADLSGDTDGDGDIDVLLTYGARSFSILDSAGRVVFDSGAHIEQFIATQGAFNAANPGASGAYDDARADDKGPEPEGVTIASIGGRSLAFVGLERGGGGVMVYDITDVGNVQFVTYARNAADVSPEGLTYVSAEDSPTGQALLALTSEVTNTLTLFGLTRIVQGTEGDDRLLAVAGVDELTGGAGADRFVFRKASEVGIDEGARDVITDFEAGIDVIDLRGIDAHAGRGGNQAFRLVDEFTGRAAQLTVEDLPAGPGGNGVLLCGDVDGDGIADFRIEVIGATELGRADILL